MAPSTSTIYIVDDDEPVRNGLALLFQAEGYEARQYADAGEFLRIAADGCIGPGCIVLDQHMPGMSGLELQTQLAELDIGIPIIFLTGHATVPAAVQAMQEGAVDFLEKPFDSVALLAKVAAAVARCHATWDAHLKMQQCLGSLTQRERDVLDRIVAGKANKVIAQDLQISERTVEIHRSRVMHKLGVNNAAQLVSLVLPARGN